MRTQDGLETGETEPLVCQRWRPCPDHEHTRSDPLAPNTPETDRVMRYFRDGMTEAQLSSHSQHKRTYVSRVLVVMGPQLRFEGVGNERRYYWKDTKK